MTFSGQTAQSQMMLGVKGTFSQAKLHRSKALTYLQCLLLVMHVVTYHLIPGIEEILILEISFNMKMCPRVQLYLLTLFLYFPQTESLFRSFSWLHSSGPFPLPLFPFSKPVLPTF